MRTLTNVMESVTPLYEFINEESILTPTQDKVVSAANKIADVASFPKKSQCVKNDEGWFTYTWNLSPEGLDEYIQDEDKFKKLKVAKSTKISPNTIQMCFRKNAGTIFGHVIGYVHFIGHNSRYQFCFAGGGYDGEVWDNKNFKQKAYDLFCKIRDNKDVFQEWAKTPYASKNTYISYERYIKKFIG